MRAPWLQRFLGIDPALMDYDISNNFAEKWSNAADTASVETIRVDTDDVIRVGHEAINPDWKTVTFNLQLNGSLGTQAFFIADRAYNVRAIYEIHKTLGTNGSAVTTSVTKDTSTQAPGAGTALMTGTFNMKATVNTLQTATLAATPGADPAGTLTLAAGDRLSVLFSGVLTALAGVVITVILTPMAKGETAVFYVNANADLQAAQAFFLANRTMTISSVKAVWSTAFAAAVTLDITKDTSTNAPGAGTSILLATVAADGTANTVVTPALAATAATLVMAPGDRLSAKLSATTTGVGLVIVVTFTPVYGRKETSLFIYPNAQQQISQCFFIADRDYEIFDISEVHAVAAGGAATIKISIDRATDVPGGGLTIAGNTGALSFDLNGTANTVQVTDSTNTTLTATFPRRRILRAGDRLGVNIASGAAQSLAGLLVTASLRPV